MEKREEGIETPDDHPRQGYNERIVFQKQFLGLTTLHQIFLICCVVAVSLDPLFFYIPVINDKKKCLQMDEKLKKTVLVLRSLMDITYIFHVAFQIISWYIVSYLEPLNMFAKSASWRINWFIIIIDIMLVLPIPQLVMFVNFLKLNKREFLNFIFLLQFVPRTIRIYHSSNELAKHLSPRKIAATALVKGLFNFFLYIIASHLFGAFWYLLSVQRESACWQHACKGNSLCSHSNLFCNHRPDIVDDPNARHLKLSCSPTPDSPFDFEMFSPALKSRIVYLMDFPRKFFYCFSWGLRNLSSFGSNLQTSTYFWENLFSAAITVIGLLLFICLIGNLQTYLQFSAQDSEKRRREMEKKEAAIDKWIISNDIPTYMGKALKDWARYKMDEHEDVNVASLVNVLPNQIRKCIKWHMCSPILKKVTQLTEMSKKQIEIFTDHLKLMVFKENEVIFNEKQPLLQMLFITQGSVWVSSPARTDPVTLKRGDFYGEELLEWAVTASASQAPSSQPPASQAPSSQVPASEAPSSETSSSQAPSSQAPFSQAPSSQAASSQAVSSQAPSSQAPASEAPSSEAPSSQAPSSKARSSQDPSSEAPSSQARSSQAPFPTLPKTVKVKTKVEAFTLDHDAVKKIASARETPPRDTKKKADYLIFWKREPPNPNDV